MPRPLYLARIDPRTRPDPPADPRPTRHRGQGIGGGAVRGDGRGFVFAVFLTVTERLRRFAPPPIPPRFRAPPPYWGGADKGDGGKGPPPDPDAAWVLGLGGLALARTLARRAILVASSPMRSRSITDLEMLMINRKSDAAG